MRKPEERRAGRQQRMTGRIAIKFTNISLLTKLVSNVKMARRNEGRALKAMVFFSAAWGGKPTEAANSGTINADIISVVTKTGEQCQNGNIQ